jgi:hypothetical protein
MLIPSEEIAALKEQLEKFVSSEVMLNKLLADNAALKAEVERLRGAIQQIMYLTRPKDMAHERETGWGYIQAIREWCLAALSQPEKEKQ